MTFNKVPLDNFVKHTVLISEPPQLISYLYNKLLLLVKYCSKITQLHYYFYHIYLCPGYPSEYLLFKQDPMASNAALLQKF